MAEVKRYHPIIHAERFIRLVDHLGEPINQYFPELIEAVRSHLEEFSFDASASTTVEGVESQVGSLISIADLVTQRLQLLEYFGWKIPPPSVVRPVWKSQWKTDFLEGGQLYGFLKNRDGGRRYLLYSTFRRSNDYPYSDLAVLFQMLKPGENTGPNEVHCRVVGDKGEQRAVAQGIEVYKALGYVDIEVDGEVQRVGPEEEFDTVVVPPGSRHRVSNISDKRSQLLIVMGGGSKRGYKLRENGKIEIEKGVRIEPPELPEQFKDIVRFRKSGDADTES